jgi:hypothetical protein
MAPVLIPPPRCAKTHHSTGNAAASEARGGTYHASLEPLASITCERIGSLPPLARYVEPLSDARTPLADFFSILLENTYKSAGILPEARSEI